MMEITTEHIEKGYIHQDYKMMEITTKHIEKVYIYIKIIK